MIHYSRILFLSLFALSAAHAGKDGDGVPTPNDVSNHYSELADQERYDLEGRIEIREIKGARGVKYPVLVVDLRKHPWLGGARRSKDPAYRIQGTVAQWSELAGKDVRFKGIAHGAIVQAHKKAPSEYVIHLELLELAPL